ncbi:hypothetical protein COV04_03625 [Candidatus Uhrbacteria bacterium CG10_big_fil_rev_8_21_14_0_10_48_11]|uniref:Enolase n=1 Tax=Candidatus Uhrbacteria bacterium CG10_big_fil_rev_8_21_14_0_10_48_11 TaxID=1975037 RepID=A0A2M8LDY6_9BACT|nr:MAG: hypothetical protein COV04_03625 [Candidatus Uhrbacteria bacterium CG10_big_fil_rev_8_21_14_0_10_48_11]
MKLDDLRVRKIFDSRGEPTIEVVALDGARVSHRAAVPSGKSRGSAEAKVFSYHEAEQSIEALRKAMLGREYGSVHEVDELLLGIDTTDTKAILGGNITLAISVALSRALAAEQSRQLSEVLHEEFFAHVSGAVRPRIYSNVINGGEHAANNLAIQEYMLVAAPKISYAELTQELVALYRTLGEQLRTSRKLEALPVGDEAGYCVDFKNNEEPLKILSSLIEESSLSDRLSLALDAAASSFYHDGSYRFGGKTINAGEMVEVYKKFTTEIPRLISIEDPFAEDDAEGFAALLEALPNLSVVGDDLTVTNPKRIEGFAERACISGVIIKPNQVGTVSESCRALEIARQHKLTTIVSHRSGETDDPFIIELAKAGSADAVKIGAPRNERINKYNELIRLYDE